MFAGNSMKTKFPKAEDIKSHPRGRVRLFIPLLLCYHCQLAPSPLPETQNVCILPSSRLCALSQDSVTTYFTESLEWWQSCIRHFKKKFKRFSIKHKTQSDMSANTCLYRDLRSKEVNTCFLNFFEYHLEHRIDSCSDFQNLFYRALQNCFPSFKIDVRKL